MTDATGGSRYRAFVRPAHSLVEELLRPRDGIRPVRSSPLATVLDALKPRIRYSSAPGHRSFDDLLAEYRAAGSRHVPMNCINATCVAVSMLRHEGWSPRQVFVALGSRRRLEHVHAWTLAATPSGPLWIDPSTLEPRAVTGDWILREHALHVIFNDAQFLFQDRDKRALLTEGGT